MPIEKSTIFAKHFTTKFTRKTIKLLSKFHQGVLYQEGTQLNPSDIFSILIFFNWDSLHARLTSYSKKKRLKDTGNLSRKNLQLKDAF